MDSSSVPPALLLGAAAASAFGSVVAAGDAALSALSPARLSALADQSSTASRDALTRFARAPSKTLGRWLVLRTIATALVAVLFDEVPLLAVTGARPLLAVGAALVTCGTLYELASALARARAVTVAPLMLRVLRPIELVVAPVADPLSAMGRWVSERLAPADPSAEGARSEARLAESEVEHLVEDAEKAGQIAAEPAELIRNVLDFKDRVARDVMVPRIKVTHISVEQPIDETARQVAEEGHSRYPVYAGKTDNVVGVLHAKDLFRRLATDRLGDATVRAVMRAPVQFIPETQAVSAVLRDMRARRDHLAIVIDEYGGVSGIVTLEDILEEIVGDIRDEHDLDEPLVEDLGDGRYLADASVSLGDLSSYLGQSLHADGDFGSLGGLLTSQLGRVPAVGEAVHASGVELVVREADEKRVIKVEIVTPPPRSIRVPRPASG
ncbi:MAG: HlyC/CorC family transporter [Polyangiaceae bacterium]|nr:HlyC/CorC family transporter [Polyangiaceae bacterium]